MSVNERDVREGATLFTHSTASQVERRIMLISFERLRERGKEGNAVLKDVKAVIVSRQDVLQDESQNMYIMS
jgi:hypothetical protein